MFNVISKAVIDGHTGVVNIDIGEPDGHHQTAHALYRREPTNEVDSEWITVYKNAEGRVVEIELGGFNIRDSSIPYLSKGKSEDIHEEK